MAFDDRSRAKAWVIDARRRAGVILPSGLIDRAGWLRKLLSEWALAEVAPGRLVPWLPVVFGLGIVVYFTADREPAWWAASGAAIAAIALAVALRRRAVGFPLALGLAAIAAGFSVATLKTTRIAHPVLEWGDGAALDRRALRAERGAPTKLRAALGARPAQHGADDIAGAAGRA